MSRQLPKIAVGALGGTICMTASDGGGVVPQLSAADLVAAVPGLTEHVTLHVETLLQLPSSALGFTELLTVLGWARQQIEQGANAVVLTQGTDTLEETAFFLDLYWQHPQPLVLTGAMRSPQMAGADGPANLLAATLTAAHPSSRQRGVLVVMNDTVHAARRVRKQHSLAVDAFVSPDGGPLASFAEQQLIWFHPEAARPPPLPAPATTPRVALLETCLGDQGELLTAVASGDFQGLVLSGFGAGHVAPAFAERLSRVCAELPMVMASRAGAGTTARATYGAIGSEIDLQRRGVIMAGDLDARKARLLLWALLAAGIPRGHLASSWQNWLGYGRGLTGPRAPDG